MELQNTFDTTKHDLLIREFGVYGFKRETLLLIKIMQWIDSKELVLIITSVLRKTSF